MICRTKQGYLLFGIALLGFHSNVLGFSSTKYLSCMGFTRSLANNLLLAAKHNSDGEDEALPSADNDGVRLDVRNFLTQRSIQSFMFLLDKCRDPHSINWIEEFLSTSNQLEYHGTGAEYMESFGGTWEAPLVQMIQQPKDVVVIQVQKKGFGGSKNNPYLQDSFMEYTVDIDPTSLVSRILSVREQIAKEWVNDLEFLSIANDQILQSYFVRQQEERKDSNSTDQTIAFDRTAVHILNNHTAFNAGSSSPFRKGSFDLLHNLCTQLSVHRVLGDLRELGEAKEVSFAWLKAFYNERVADYFDGDQKYGRADDFMEELLLRSPSLIYTDDGKAGLADPMALVELIIEKRKEIIKEWKATLKETPSDHLEVRKHMLIKHMEMATIEKLEEDFSFDDGFDELSLVGAFE